MALLVPGGCVEPYVPAVLSAPTSLLVVDGFIKGNGVTRVQLARTANLAATAALPVEKGAKLFIMDNAGGRYALSEKTPGNYQSDSLLLPAGRQYQLRITTTQGATYESALVPLLVTPPIDKLSWQLTGNEVQLAINTHDASAQTRFYRWNFAETWQFTAAYESAIEYRNGIIDVRTTPIYTCWRTERPSTIKQTSTAQLSQNALTDYTLLNRSARAERFKIRYSVLVSQVAETAAEFAYYELLRKNTEAVGTVNDPLPTQLTGNVHRLDNASEPVLGFVGAHTVQQQRLFIDRKELALPNGWQFDSPYDICLTARELFKDSINHLIIGRYPYTKIFSNSNNVPIKLLVWPDDDQSAPIPQGYLGSSVACVDCRVRGSNVKPSFW